MELMDGVRILATIPSNSWMQLVLILVGFLGLIFCACWFYVTVTNCDITKKWSVISLIVGILFLLILLIGGVSSVKHPYYRYKVTISEEVDLKEFQEEYMIAGQEGDIYTIIDRNQPLL